MQTCFWPRYRPTCSERTEAAIESRFLSVWRTAAPLFTETLAAGHITEAWTILSDIAENALQQEPRGTRRSHCGCPGTWTAPPAAE